MERRQFLRLLGFGAIGAAAVGVGALELDPEKALWVPSRKMIVDLGDAGIRRDLDATVKALADSIDRAGLEAYEAAAGNRFLTIDMITKEALRVLENNLTFAKGVDRAYGSAFAQEGARIGAVAHVRKPMRYRVG